ncbi:MAG: adenylate/guanylate cyclase domain-containing protein [Bacteroidales bacterium]
MAYKILTACGSEKLIQEVECILGLAEDEFQVRSITDVEKIIATISEFNPDILLFDVHFANNAAADILSVIKADPLTTYTPILALADFLQPEKIQALFHAGADDFIGQPISASELIQRIMVGIQRGRLLQKLKDQSNQLNDISSAISKAGNSIVVINDQGQITWVNEGFKLLYECTLSEFRKAYGNNLFSQETNPNTYNALTKCKDLGEYVTYDSTWTTFNGKEKFIQTTLTPIFDSLQNFSHIIAIESDITELKNIEKSLEEKHKHLLSITKNLENANAVLEKQQQEIQIQSKLLEEEKLKSENLLKNILPWEVAYSLQKKGIYKPKKFKEVSVMFTDFVGFSKVSVAYENIDEFLNVLSNYFEAFDEITSQRFIEKIKTIGDSYMCAGGLPRTNRSHPFDTVLAALEIQRYAKAMAELAKEENKSIWSLRVGIHSGSVIAGVIGKHKFAYDIWGDTVNVASRMETACETGKVNISETTYAYIKDYFTCTPRGKIPAKNIGEIEMFFVERIKPEYSEDNDGFIPNATFRKILSSL